MALFDDALKYGVTKQMFNTVKNTVSSTISEGFGAGWKVLKNAYGGGEVDKARRIIKAGMNISSEGSIKEAQDFLLKNTDTLTKASNKMGWFGGNVDVGDMEKYINNKATFDTLKDNLYGTTKYMEQQGHMTIGGKVGLGAAAYIGTTKALTDDHDAPLIPFI